MGILRATVTLNRYSGLAEDAVQNTWHFRYDAGDGEGAASVVDDELSSFYVELQEWLSPSLATAVDAHRIDFATVTPGAPGEDDDTVSPIFATEYFTLATPGGAYFALPAEVASCLSMTAVGAGTVPEKLGSLRPRARYRGRQYIGPLSTGVLFQAANGEALVKQAFIDDVLAVASEHFFDDLVEGEPVLGIYSRANATCLTVEKLWMDDAFDIIRSRGQAPTNRTTVVPG